jgi:hypothetical protein
MSIFEQWKAGDVGTFEALRALTSDLAEVESELEPVQKEREQLRAQVSELVDAAGGKAEIRGFGKLEITSASRTTSYDKKALQGLVNDLVAEGWGEIARRILDCEKESARAGSLRITREKQVPA